MKKKDSVLYISYDGMTDPLGQSQVLPYLTKLSEEYDIHILSAEKEENYKLRKNVIEQICAEHNINWHPINYTKTPPVVSTIKDILNLRKTTFKLHQKYHFKILHCRSYIAALVGLEMKRKHGTKFIFDMRGFWADERVDGNIWNISNPVFKRIYNYFKKKEIQFFQQADYTVSLTEAGKKEILSWPVFKSNPPKIEVIPCCADLDHFSPNNVQPKLVESFRKELDLTQEDFVISYLGSIGTWYMLDEMLDFFKVLNQHQPNAKFLFITGDNPNDILNAVERKNITKNSIRIIRGERKDLPSLISVSHVSIFFIKPAYSKKASSPTKQAELLALGIPIICNGNVGDTGDIILNNKAGYVLNEFNNDTYEKCLSQLDQITQLDKSHLREVAKSYASLTIGADRYLKIYQKVLE